MIRYLRRLMRRRESAGGAMKIFSCLCGQRLFYENSRCLQCGRQLAWCPSCTDLSPIVPVEGDAKRFRCARKACGAELWLCYNYHHHGVCNRGLLVPESAGDNPEPRGFCDMCAFNATIPDLSVEGNREAWARLESAKRRVLRQFRILHLPPYRDTRRDLSLRFDFKADAIPTETGWRPMAGEKVYTGYAKGKITINVRESDSVERERMRVSFGESYRTLVGHFRHELAHYLWDACIDGTEHEAGFTGVFGDPHEPGYGDALKAYYAKGAPEDWETAYVSAYATMHPFEDWAETAASLLHMHSILETARCEGVLDLSNLPFGERLRRYIDFGIFLNEVNRDMGLTDVVPTVFNPPVREKMAFIAGVLLPWKH